MGIEIKQKANRNFIIAVVLGILCALTVYSAYIFVASGQEGTAEVSNLQAEKDEKRRQLEQIKAEVNRLNQRINEQRGQIASLNNEVALFDLQIEQTEQQIRAYNAEIEVLNLEIIETLNFITKAESDIATKKEHLIALIREMYQQDETSPLEIVLTNANFSDFLNVMQDTLTLQNRNQELLDELKNLKADLDFKQATLKTTKSETEVLKTAAEQTHLSLANQRSQRENLLSYTQGRESEYQALLAHVSEQESQIQREVFDLDLQIRRQLGDRSLPTVTNGLTWPMDGILTQGYGNTGFTRLGYSFHNGLDIAAPANTPIRTAGDGVVYAVGTGQAAYGNWAVIRHSIETDQGIKNIMTLYAHLNRIMVSTGQGVLAGDIIGLEGNTGNTTRLIYGPERGYHLHFTIFDEEGFGISNGAYPEIYGPYQIPHGYSYNPMDFLR